MGGEILFLRAKVQGAILRSGPRSGLAMGLAGTLLCAEDMEHGRFDTCRSGQA